MGSWKIRTSPASAVLVVSISLTVIWVTGQILRDRTGGTALMFYFPTPVLVAWLSLIFAMSATRRRLYLCLLAGPLVMLLVVENHWVRPGITATEDELAVETQDVLSPDASVSPIPLRLIHWNLGRGLMGWERQWQHINSLRPDIVVLSEIPEPFDVTTLVGFDVLVVDSMAVACHGTLTTSPSLVRGGALQANHVTCHLSEGPLEVMIADMTSRVSVPRDLYLRPFVELLEKRNIDVSVGDFNAPRRSLAFCSLPGGYQHAYDEAGAGWSYTWPVPVPFLAIDQCITGPRVKSVHYDLQSTWLSDHRLQVLDFEWLPWD